MKILVTGAGGFVGSYLVPELVSCGHKVAATFLNSEILEKRSNTTNLAEQSLVLDITDSKRCFEVVEEAKPDAVIHLAGIAFAPSVAKNFSLGLNVHVGGTENICKAIAQYANGIPFLYISSGEVYGKITKEDLPITEDLLPKPNNPYSVTKLQAEEVVKYYGRRELLSATVVRPFNHIGPGQDENFVCSSFASQIVEATKSTAPVVKVGNLEARRDFMDVRDVVRAYSKLLSAAPGVYNLCSGRSVPIREILDTLIEISGAQIEVQQDESRMRASEVPEIRGSYDKASKEIGWEPKISLKESLSDIYKSFE